MPNKNQDFILDIVYDFLDHISVYREDIQEEIVSLAYFITKKKNNEKERKVKRNASVLQPTTKK